MTYVFTPDNLTGDVVIEIRQRHKLSRGRFSELAGFEGRSTARLYNIEVKNSWKAGDREAVARVLNDLTGGQFDPRYHATSAAAATSDEPPPVSVLVDDDPDAEVDEVAHVVSPPEPILIPTIDVVPDVARQTDGVYEVSNGEAQTFKRCRRKWWLGWYRGLTLRTEDFTGVRSVGDRVHRALQRWYVPETQVRVDPRDALERVIVDDWTRVEKLAAERGLSAEQRAELARRFAESTNLERAMIEGYVQWLEETGADAELRVIASETPLRADLDVTVNGVDRPIRAIGLLDVRVHRVTDGRNLFLDHKTVGDLNSPSVTLALNEQMLHYDMLEWLNTPLGEQRCDGALYNMLRRVKRTARANPPFYGRVEVHHNVRELESYKRRLLAVTRDVLTTIDALDRGESHLDVAYPSPQPRCSWDCDFLPVCNLLDDGSPGVDDMLNVLYRTHDPRDRYDKTEGRME